MQVQDQLEAARSAAERAEHAPFLGGRFSLVYGGLAAAALTAHYFWMTGAIDLGVLGALYIWGAFGIAGVAISALAARGLERKPGLASPANRASSAFWQAGGPAIAVFAVSLVAAASLRSGIPAELFDTIIAVVFLLYAIVSTLTAVFTGSDIYRAQAVLSFAFASAVLLMVGLPELYLVAALGAVILQVVPGLLQMRREPEAVA